MVEFEGSHREWQQMVYGMDDDFYDKDAVKWASEMRKKLRGPTARWLRRYLKHPERHITTDPMYCRGCPFKDTHDYIYEKVSSQLSGWCYYMNTGDFMPEGTSILWDGCKECGVNDDWSELEAQVERKKDFVVLGSFDLENGEIKNIRKELSNHDRWMLSKKGGSKKTKAKRLERALYG